MILEVLEGKFTYVLHLKNGAHEVTHVILKADLKKSKDARALFANEIEAGFQQWEALVGPIERQIKDRIVAEVFA